MPKYVDLGYDGSLSIAEIMATAKQEANKEERGEDNAEKEKGGE